MPPQRSRTWAGSTATGTKPSTWAVCLAAGSVSATTSNMSCLQPFVSRNIDELVQQTPAHPAVAIGRVNDHPDFPDMLACSSAAMVQGAIADDRAVQEREQWQDPTVVQGLGPAGDNLGVGHIFLQSETVLLEECCGKSPAERPDPRAPWGGWSSGRHQW